jgi:hypothetical protein
MGGGGIAPPFMTPALHGGKWSVCRRGSFTAGEKAPGALAARSKA